MRRLDRSAQLAQALGRVPFRRSDAAPELAPAAVDEQRRRAADVLVVLLGRDGALQLEVESERIAASKALEWGLVNRVVPAETLLDAAIAWAQSLAARAQVSVAGTKQAVRYAMTHSYEDTFRLEAQLQARCLESPDFAEGVRAFIA